MATNTETTEPERYLALPAMRLTIEIVGYASSSVTLPDDVAAWLIEVADMAHVQPATLCGSVLTDVSREDRMAHGQEPSILQ